MLLGQALQRIARDHYIYSIAAETRLGVGRVLDFVIGSNWAQIPTESGKGHVVVH